MHYTNRRILYFTYVVVNKAERERGARNEVCKREKQTGRGKKGGRESVFMHNN